MLVRKPIIATLTNHLIFYPTPLNLTYSWGFGSVAGLFLVCQILTGIILAMHYTPQFELAFASVEHIMRDVNNGWLVRYSHANGASFFFFIVYAHIGRSLYYAFYYPTRLLLWFSGLGIFLAMMAIAFMGYVLPWGQMSFWGATVITNLFSAIPQVGTALAAWLWGGFAVGNATLVRFFSLHYLLPFVLVGLIGLHLIALHSFGSHNSLGFLKNTDKIFFYPYFYVKDYFGFLLGFFCLFFFVCYAPDYLGHPDNYTEANPLVTPTHIVPEWYFLPFYAILRAVPSKLGGVFLMVFSIGILLFLPWLPRYRAMTGAFRWFYTWGFWGLVWVLIGLGILGGLPIEEPYPVVAQILSLLYFSYFSFFVGGEILFSRFLVYRHTISVNFISTPQRPVPAHRPPKSGRGRFCIVYTIPQPKPEALSLMRLLGEKLHIRESQITACRNSGCSSLQSAFSRIGSRSFNHGFHLVTTSPWPFLSVLPLFALVIGAVAYFHRFYVGAPLILFGFCSFLFVLSCWFRDIIREGTFEGYHTLRVQRGLKSGMLLFILSEVMFFLSFFWAFFHSSLAPAIQIGGIWPPLGISVFNPWEIPLLNTLILLTSGVTVTWAHYAIRLKSWRFFLTLKFRYFFRRWCYRAVRIFRFPRKRPLFKKFYRNSRLVSVLSRGRFTGYQYTLLIACRVHWIIQDYFHALHVKIRWRLSRFFARSRAEVICALGITICLGCLFTCLQGFEYIHAPFTISDSIYGSTFFLLTGFHGFHVIIGTCLLLVAFLRMLRYHYTRQHHIGFESAIWYWHFVDVVWLGLYVSIYHWGS